MKGLIISAKVKTVLISVAGVLLIYTLVGFWLLPALMLRQIPELTKEKLNRTTQIRDIHFNPFSMELAIDGFDLKNRNDDNTFIGFERFYIDLALFRSIGDLTLSIERVDLSQPIATIKRNRQGDFNFSDLLENESPEEPSETTDTDIFPVVVSQIAVTEGKLSWEDGYYGPLRQEEIYPLNLNLSDFTTLADKQSQLGFSLKFASGGTFEWRGSIGLNPLFSEGKITLEQVNFPKVWELFLKDAVNFEILKGSEAIEADYRLNDSAEGLQLIVDNTRVRLYDIEIAEKGSNEALIEVPAFNLSGISVDLLKKKVRIAKISAQNASFKTWLTSDGSINYQSLFVPESEDEPAQSKKQKTADNGENAWRVKIDHLALNNFAVNFTDRTLQNPAPVKLSALNLELLNLDSRPGSHLPFQLGLAVNDSGKLNVKGDTVLEPFSGALKVEAADIAIKDFQPYIDQAVRLDIISGLFNVNTEISLRQDEENKPLAITLHGDSDITDFVTRDRISNKDFVKWKRLSLNGIDLSPSENRYNINKVSFEKPYARVLIRKDKSVNVSDIALEKSSEEPTAAVAEPKTEATEKSEPTPPTFKIARIELTDGESDFADLSLILPFAAHIDHLSGSITSIASDQNAFAHIDLAGKVDGLAPVNIQGKINPYRGDSEVALDFRSMSLPLVTPYMAEFAGRKIEKGNMSLGLKYNIRGSQLTASNNLLIEHLVLGDKVENPKAVSLPLDLAIALLEDGNGKIALDVPITGSLEDPEFSVAGVIVDALVNVITKVVSSPFNAIASLIGSEEDISAITFPAGATKLTEEQQEKLNGLADALNNRPGLNLEIKGTAFTEQDWPALQTEALNYWLVEIRADELNRDNGKKISPETIQLSDDEYRRLLADLFIREFPQLAERSFFGTPQLIEPQTGDFYAVAKVKLAAAIPPNPERLQKLAIDRAQAIAKHLVDKGVAVERLFVLDAAIDPEKNDNLIASKLNLTAR